MPVTFAERIRPGLCSVLPVVLFALLLRAPKESGTYDSRISRH